jgi:hypothetical protein
MIGSKAQAKITSEIKYKSIIICQGSPLLWANSTPAGIPPPKGMRKITKTLQRFAMVYIELLYQGILNLTIFLISI